MRPQKITFGEMRSGGGPTGILVYCAGLPMLALDRVAFQRPRDKKLRLADAKQMFLEMRDIK
jgi:hypothetical protein